MRPELRPGACSSTGLRAVPLHGLAGDGSDAFEVMVAVQEGQSLEFRGRGNDEVGGSRTAVLTALGQQLLNLPGPVKPARPQVRQAPHMLANSGSLLDTG